MTKIMLVEDDDNLREIYGARLIAEGYEIISARDGEEALALAIKEKPDLLISDVMMPKISGFDMLDILRTSTETKNIKVIMMTALSQTEDKDRADKLGADRYLVKSQVTLEDVVKVTREVLEGAPAVSTSSSEPIAPITGVDLSLPNMGQNDSTQTTEDTAQSQTSVNPASQTTTDEGNATQSTTTENGSQSTASSNDDAAKTDEQPVKGAPLNTNKEAPEEKDDEIIEQPEPETIKPTIKPDMDDSEEKTGNENKEPKISKTTELTPSPIAAVVSSTEPEQVPDLAITPQIVTPEPASEAPAETPTAPETPKETPAETPTAPETVTPTPDSTPKAESEEKIAEEVKQDAQTTDAELKTVEDQIKEFVNTEPESPDNTVGGSGEININEDGSITTVTPTETSTKVVTPEPASEAPAETPTAPETVTPTPDSTPKAESEKTPEEKHKEKKVIQPLGDPSLKVPDINELLEKELEKEQLNDVIQQAGIITGSMSTPPNQDNPSEQNPNNVSL